MNVSVQQRFPVKSADLRLDEHWAKGRVPEAKDAMASRNNVFRVVNSPAAERNKEPIENVLKKYVRDSPDFVTLEVAAGFGTHAAHNASKFKNSVWYVTEGDPACLKHIEANLQQDQGLMPTNVRGPYLLNLSSEPVLPEEVRAAKGSFDVVLAINMIHITAWRNVCALFDLAGSVLNRSRGRLITYGPYSFYGKLEPESNVHFDKSLRLQNDEWGVRDLKDLEAEASRNGMVLECCHPMPSNNHVLVWAFSKAENRSLEA